MDTQPARYSPSRKPARRIVRLLVGAAISAAAAGLTQPATADDDAVMRLGRKIALSGTEPMHANCAACHMAHGEGQPAVGIPRLAGLPADYLERQLAYFASGERGSAIMAPYARVLDEAQRQAVARYFAAQAPQMPAYDLAAPPSAALRQRGRDLYEHGDAERRMPACAQCHGPQAQGIPLLSPPLAGQSSGYIVRQLEQWHAGALRGPAGKFMRAEAAKLNSQDMQALAAYLAALAPQPAPRNGDGQ